jgi:hypothetical protein
VDHANSNKIHQRLSTLHDERILRRNQPPASFCENFALAAFSTFQHNPLV